MKGSLSGIFANASEIMLSEHSSGSWWECVLLGVELTPDAAVAFRFDFSRSALERAPACFRIRNMFFDGAAKSRKGTEKASEGFLGCVVLGPGAMERNNDRGRNCLRRLSALCKVPDRSCGISEYFEADTLCYKVAAQN